MFDVQLKKLCSVSFFIIWDKVGINHPESNKDDNEVKIRLWIHGLDRTKSYRCKGSDDIQDSLVEVCLRMRRLF